MGTVYLRETSQPGLTKVLIVVSSQSVKRLSCGICRERRNRRVIIRSSVASLSGGSMEAESSLISASQAERSCFMVSGPA